MNAIIDISGVTLKTKRLTLRPFKKTDAADLFEYASVAGVGEAAGWSHHENLDETHFVLDKFIEEKRVFAVEYNNKVIGSVGLERFAEGSYPELKNMKGTEIGYAFSKDFWGLGLATEAVNEVIALLFEKYGLDFVLAGYFKENLRSARVQQKTSFQYLKTLPRLTAWGEEKQTIMNVLFKRAYLDKKKS